MTPDQFIADVTVPAENRDPDVSEQIFRRAREKVRRLADAERFTILFPLAVKSQSDVPSYSAAQILQELSPSCPLPCEEAVRALLPDWDVSIEEVPFYLAARFGVKRVRQAAKEIEASVTSESAKRMMQTVCYWLNIYEQAYPENHS